MIATNIVDEGLPNETLLHVFSFLPLKALICARGVSSRWRHLVLLSDILPSRRSLLELYLTLLQSCIFRLTRPWVIANLTHFDRQKYIDDLTQQHPYIPEAFRIWILEWPAKAVFGCVWPGLPNVYTCRRNADDVHRMEGANWLSPLPPTVCSLALRNYTPDAEFIPALYIFQRITTTTWLVLDERDSLCNKVYCLIDGGNDLEDENGAPGDQIHDNWVDWLRYTWDYIETTAWKRMHKGLPIMRLADMQPDIKIVSGPYWTLCRGPDELQGPPWSSRNDPDVIQRELAFDEFTDLSPFWGERVKFQR